MTRAAPQEREDFAALLADAATPREKAGICLLALRAEPENPDWKRKFIALAGDSPFSQYNPDVEDALRACLEDPRVDCASAYVLWVSLLTLEPGFSALFQHTERKPAFWSRRQNPFLSAPGLAPLLRPFFLRGIERIVVCNLRFERFMTLLREFLVTGQGPARQKLGENNYTALTTAVAAYAFHTGYILDCSPAETETARILRAAIESGKANEGDLAAYACVAPLHTLKNAESAPLLLRAQQVDAPAALAARAEKIGGLTPVKGNTTLKVRAMYEEDPYPLWRELTESGFYRQPPDAAVLETPGAKALVAGCGTGREAAQLAALYPGADFLGVDITRASLAWATQKSEEYKLSNISFRQGDILKLGEALKPEYGYVHCAGVLHHMDDVLEGWRVLEGLTRPGGTMFIGLYSEIARRAVVAARDAIAKGGYPATNEGMRQFRKDSPKLLAPEHMAVLLSALDYYYLPMYRDLLFHVHERRVTIPGIMDMLKALNLSFMGFRLPEETLAAYRAAFPADPAALDLNNWQSFEEANPHTFIHSYKFWCGKAQGPR